MRLKAGQIAAAPSGLKVAYGRVTVAPADEADSVSFVYEDARSGGDMVTFFWPRSTVLPAVDDRVVVADGPAVSPFILSRET